MPPPTAPSRTLLRAARAAAVSAVAAAAAVVLREGQRERSRRARRKGEGDFVTAVDIQCERLLRDRLSKALPQAGFLGEETGSNELDAEFVWVVDPIDGTSNFANGLPHWAVAVALLHQGRPVVAATWSQPDGVVHAAALGMGATHNGLRVRAPKPRWDDSSIVGCQWHRGQQQMEFLASLQHDGARIRTFGSTVVQGLDVAMGRLSANVQQQGRLWDFAAPALVLLELGGKVVDWAGKDVFPLRSLATGHVPTVMGMPAVVAPILRRLRPHRLVVSPP